MQHMLGALTVVAALLVPPAAGAAPPIAPAVVHIRNFAFVPATLSIVAGQTVRFINDDGEAHTVTARDASFDSGGFDTHDAWQHTFSAAGTYAYVCQLHPMMTATIVVRRAGPQA